MVNAGKRSKCCFACRQRRVRCDLQKPQCWRCIVGGRICPGYPETWDVMLRMQNNYAETIVQTRVNKVQAKRIEELLQKAAIIPPEVHVAAEVHCWNRFYQDYVVDSGIAVFNVLPMFCSSSSSACFLEALQAVTLASSAHQLDQPGLMIRAKGHHGRAIASVIAALNDPVRTADDSVLLALFLLSLYQIMVPEPLMANENLQCQVHSYGTLSLLQWRSEQARDSELDQSVFVFFTHISLMGMFLDYEPCDAKWSALETNPWANGRLLEPILRRAIDFKRCARAQVNTAAKLSPRKDMVRLIEDGIRISEDLETIATRIESLGSIIPSRQQPTAFNNLFEVSTKTTQVIARSLYRAVRYHIVDVVSGLSDFMQDEVDGNGHESIQRLDPLTSSAILQEICDDICSILQLDFEADTNEDDRTGKAYRAFCAFWPMVILLFSPSAGVERRTWIQNRLQFIGQTTGFGLATWSARIVNSLRPIQPQWR